MEPRFVHSALFQTYCSPDEGIAEEAAHEENPANESGHAVTSGELSVEKDVESMQGSTEDQPTTTEAAVQDKESFGEEEHLVQSDDADESDVPFYDYAAHLEDHV